MIIDDFVNEGWHCVGNIFPTYRRVPHSEAQPISSYNDDSTLRSGAFFRTPIREANLGGAMKYDFEGGSVFVYLRDSFRDFIVGTSPINEGPALEPDKGLVRKISVFSEMHQPDERTLVNPEIKVLGFVVKEAKYNVQRGKQYFSPLYVDANDSITTENNNTQRLHGFRLDFPDFRWNARGGNTTNYLVILGEDAHRELQVLIQKNPLTLFDVYAKAFPQFVQAKGNGRGRYLEHPKLSQIFYVENTADFARIK